MAGDINDVTIQYEEDGQVLVKELDKVILSKGAWSTIIFRCQQWEGGKGQFSKDRYTIRRYRKVGNEYLQQSKFTISSPDQAEKLIDALRKWI